MATPVVITHPFASLKADGPDPTLVRPSAWNANHKVTGGADGQLVVFDSTSATGLAFANAVTASLTNQTGGTLAVGDVVAVSLAADSTVVLSDSVSSALQFVVSLGTPVNAAAGNFAVRGPVVGVKAQGGIPAGNYVRKSATTKAVEDTGVLAAAGTPPPAGTIGFATTVAAAGLVNLWLFGVTTVVATPPAASVYLDELSGLGLTFNTTVALTVAAGASASDDATVAGRVLMVLASAIQGTTAGTWVVGNAQPKLDAGAIGNNQTWHVFEIQRPDTGVVDIAFSQSLVTLGAAVPAAYTKKRRIASFMTNAAALIRPFTQDGEEFLHASPLLDVDVLNPGVAAVTRVLTIPTGVKHRALVNVYLEPATTGTDISGWYLSPLDTVDVAPSKTVAPLYTFKLSGGGNGFNGAMACPPIRTDTAASIRSRVGPNSGAGDIFRIATLGWLDRRGCGV